MSICLCLFSAVTLFAASLNPTSVLLRLLVVADAHEDSLAIDDIYSLWQFGECFAYFGTLADHAAIDGVDVGNAWELIGWYGTNAGGVVGCHVGISNLRT